MFEIIENIYTYIGAIILILFFCWFCTNGLIKNLFILYPTINNTTIMLREYKSAFLIVRKIIILAEFLILFLTIYLASTNAVLFILSLILTITLIIVKFCIIKKFSYEQKIYYCVDFLATDVINFEWIIFNNNLCEKTKKDCLATHTTNMCMFYSKSLEYDKKLAFYKYIDNLNKQGLTEQDIENILFTKPLKFNIYIENQT